MKLFSATPLCVTCGQLRVWAAFSSPDVAVTLWRSRALARGDYFELGLSAASIVVVWLVYRRQLLGLNRVAERIDDKAIASLSVGAFMMVIFVYGFVGQALKDMHH